MAVTRSKGKAGAAAARKTIPRATTAPVSPLLASPENLKGMKFKKGGSASRLMSTSRGAEDDAWGMPILPLAQDAAAQAQWDDSGMPESEACVQLAPAAERSGAQTGRGQDAMDDGRQSESEEVVLQARNQKVLGATCGSRASSAAVPDTGSRSPQPKHTYRGAKDRQAGKRLAKRSKPTARVPVVTVRPVPPLGSGWVSTSDSQANSDCSTTRPRKTAARNRSANLADPVASSSSGDYHAPVSAESTVRQTTPKPSCKGKEKIADLIDDVEMSESSPDGEQEDIVQFVAQMVPETSAAPVLALEKHRSKPSVPRVVIPQVGPLCGWPKESRKISGDSNVSGSSRPSLTETDKGDHASSPTIEEESGFQSVDNLPVSDGAACVDVDMADLEPLASRDTAPLKDTASPSQAFVASISPTGVVNGASDGADSGAVTAPPIAVPPSESPSQLSAVHQSTSSAPLLTEHSPTRFFPAPPPLRETKAAPTFFTVGLASGRSTSPPFFAKTRTRPEPVMQATSGVLITPDQAALAEPSSSSPKAADSQSTASVLTPQDGTDVQDESTGATTDEEEPLAGIKGSPKRQGRTRKAPARHRDEIAARPPSTRQVSKRPRYAEVSESDIDGTPGTDTEPDVPLATGTLPKAKKARRDSKALARVPAARKDSKTSTSIAPAPDVAKVSAAPAADHEGPFPPLAEFIDERSGRLKPGLRWKLQSRDCISLFKGPQHLKTRCAACSARKTGYICSFRDFRVWIVKEENNAVVGGPEFGNPLFALPKQDKPHLPTYFNRRAGVEDLAELRNVIALVLKRPLDEEIRFASSRNVVPAPRELKHRLECDGCQATIIGGAWMCRFCAREYCTHCHDVLLMDGNELANADPTRSINLDWATSMTSCKAHSYRHKPADMLQVFHANLPSMQAMYEDITKLCASSPPQLEHRSSKNTLPRYNELIAAFPETELATSNPYVRIDAVELGGSPEIFEHIWSKGETLVVTGMAERFKHSWSPEALKKQYGQVECKVEDTAEAFPIAKETTVARFFDTFGKKREAGAPIWKLKDWPPSEDFKNQFPQLFEDFEDAIPIPDVTRRDGIRNIAAHFARNANIPDIGPKMYIAMASSDSKGSNGSTKLHMDVADAINVQLHARIDDGKDGCALWHIYSPEETVKLREFLYGHIAKLLGKSVDEVKTVNDDPIHTQRFYIDLDMRKTLREEYGVRGWEIRQRPGEAVFIPAYCAHQVCNLADCIKVAADFVSVHSIKRCLVLTEEFRRQTHEHKKPWRYDLLQLRQMLIYAFASASRPVSVFLEGGSG